MGLETQAKHHLRRDLDAARAEAKVATDALATSTEKVEALTEQVAKLTAELKAANDAVSFRDARIADLVKADAPLETYVSVQGDALRDSLLQGSPEFWTVQLGSPTALQTWLASAQLMALFPDPGTSVPAYQARVRSLHASIDAALKAANVTVNSADPVPATLMSLGAVVPVSLVLWLPSFLCERHAGLRRGLQEYVAACRTWS